MLNNGEAVKRPQSGKHRNWQCEEVAHLAHLNARDTTLVYAWRAPQADIARLKARMGWEEIPCYTITDSFDADFGVDEYHGHNAFIRDGERVFRAAPMLLMSVHVRRFLEVWLRLAAVA